MKKQVSIIISSLFMPVTRPSIQSRLPLLNNEKNANHEASALGVISHQISEIHFPRDASSTQISCYPYNQAPATMVTESACLHQAEKLQMCASRCDGRNLVLREYFSVFALLEVTCLKVREEKSCKKSRKKVLYKLKSVLRKHQLRENTRKNTACLGEEVKYCTG